MWLSGKCAVGAVIQWACTSWEELYTGDGRALSAMGRASDKAHTLIAPIFEHYLHRSACCHKDASIACFHDVICVLCRLFELVASECKSPALQMVAKKVVLLI